MTAEEVEQGDLSDCTIAAVLASLANTEIGRHRLHQIVKFDPSASVHSRWARGDLVSAGLVGVALQSGLQEISRLLYYEGNYGDNRLLFSRSKNGGGWVSFVEKAFAAKKAGYEAIKHIGVVEVMSELTGKQPVHIQLRPVEKGKLLGSDDMKRLTNILSRATLQPTVAATPKAKGGGFNTPSGLVADHAYVVLSFRPSGNPQMVNVLDCGSGVPTPLALPKFLTEFVDVVAMP